MAWNSTRINNLLVNPNPSNCRMALMFIGQLTHMWQDYYAHAIPLYGIRDDRLYGNPYEPGKYMKPSSWGWNLGEHGAFEPGNRASDAGARQKASINWTTTKLQPLINAWWKACKCGVGGM